MNDYKSLQLVSLVLGRYYVFALRLRFAESVV